MSVLIFQRCQSHVSSTDGGFAEYVSIPSQMPARHHESQIILGNGEKLKFLQSKLKVTSEEISLESLLIISDFVFFFPPDLAPIFQTAGKPLCSCTASIY